MNKSILRTGAVLLALLLLCGCGAAPAPETAAPSAAPATGPADPVFTYRESLEEAPACWSPLDWYSEAESKVLSYTAMGLYAPALDGDGYTLLPEMAAAEPVDVSAQYGLPTGCAWRIDLNQAACWEDGTPINADTYIYSMGELLGGKHYRASGFFSDRLSIVNAWEYYMQDQAGQTVYRSLADAGYSSVAEALSDGHSQLYLDMEGFWNLSCGWQRIDSTEEFRDEVIALGEPEDYVSPSYIYNTYLADGAPYAAYQNTFVGTAETTIPAVSWEDVGFLKTGEYRITLLLEKPITGAELKWELSVPFLVKEDLFGMDYGTAADRYAACGPYRLVSAGDGGLVLERNESWYGYTDGKHAGQYQATSISCRILSPEDALTAFEAGELDTVTVTEGADALAVPQTYTSKLTFNTSRAVLARRETEGINKTILSYRDFRQAVSLAIDRQAFVEACVPAAVPTLGLLNETFLLELDAGTRYRDSAAGQQVISEVYGSAAGGYDPDRAKALLQQAYDAALTDGNISGGDVVELEFLVYSEEPVYQDIVSFLQTALDQAALGTSLEGRIRILRTVDSGYYDAAKTGEFDIILSTWGGSAADPYSILSCYCDRDKSYEFGFDPSRETCTIAVDGAAVTRTYRGWYEEMITTSDLALRDQLLAQLEMQLLGRYDCVPIYERNLLFRDGARIARPVTEAVPLLDFGGVRYARFTQDDGEVLQGSLA